MGGPLCPALAVGCPAGPLPCERLSSSLPFRGEELRAAAGGVGPAHSQPGPASAETAWGRGGEATAPSTHRRLQTQTSLMGPIHIRGGRLLSRRRVACTGSWVQRPQCTKLLLRSLRKYTICNKSSVFLKDCRTSLDEGYYERLGVSLGVCKRSPPRAGLRGTRF